MENNELMHYGVKGMKWGHRKAPEKSALRKDFDAKKSAYKKAKKEYAKSFNRAYGYSNRHPISNYGYGDRNPIGNLVSKKIKKESAKRWGDAFDKARAADSARSAYKKAKQSRKKSIKNTCNKIQRDSNFRDKLLYNNATRKKAAKYVVDYGMSVSDAKKKANRDAMRNTALILGAFAGATIASSKLL